MGVMSYNASVAAVTVVENVLSAKPEALVKVPSKVVFAVTGGGSLVYLTIVIGNEVVMDGQEVNPNTTWPKLPDDFLLEAPALPLDTINVRVHNRHATTARVVTVVVTVEPL